MTIIKRKVTRNYTIVANDCFNDKRLGGEHLGAITFLLSRPNDWAVRPAAFGRRMQWGRDKTYRLLSDLAEFGYIERRQERDLVTGSYKPVEYIVYDQPIAPVPGNPEPAKPRPVSPLPANSKAAKIISTKTNQIFPPKSPSTLPDNSGSERLSEEERRPSSRAVMSEPLISNKRPWKDRGRYEVEIAERVGDYGSDVFSGMPEYEVTTLCQRQKDGTLDDAADDPSTYVALPFFSAIFSKMVVIQSRAKMTSH
jgi:hypothetical protein